MVPVYDLGCDPSSYPGSLHGPGPGHDHDPSLVHGHDFHRAHEPVLMAVATGARQTCRHGGNGTYPLSYDIRSRGAVMSRKEQGGHWTADGSRQESESTPCVESLDVSLRIAEPTGQHPGSRLERGCGEAALA